MRDLLLAVRLWVAIRLLSGSGWTVVHRATIVAELDAELGRMTTALVATLMGGETDGPSERVH